MSTLEMIDWPTPPVIGQKAAAAAQALRGYVRSKTSAKSERQLEDLGKKIPGAKWRNYMRLHLFEHIDWGDGSNPSISTVATFAGCSNAIDNGMLLLTALRAERQAFQERKMSVRFRLVVELEHVETSTCCWLDVETGEVIAGEVWRKAEEKRLVPAEPKPECPCPAANCYCAPVQPSGGWYFRAAEKGLEKPDITRLHEDDGDTLPTRDCDFTIEGGEREVIEACKRDYAALPKWDYYIACEKKRLAWRVWQVKAGTPYHEIIAGGEGGAVKS